MSDLEQRLEKATNSEDLEKVLREIWGKKLVDKVIANSRMHAKQEADFLQLSTSISNPLEYFDAITNLFKARKKAHLLELKDFSEIKHKSNDIPYEVMSEVIKIEQGVDTQWIEMRIHNLYYPSPRKMDPFELAKTPEEREAQLISIFGEEQMKKFFEQAFDITYSLAEKTNLRAKYPQDEEYNHIRGENCKRLRAYLVTSAYRAIRKLQLTTQIPYSKLGELGLQFKRIGITSGETIKEEREM